MNNIALLLMPAGLTTVFGLATLSVRYTVVYRRNNLASGVALLLFVSSVNLCGWLGFAAFTIGTLLGASKWAACISRANDGLTRAHSTRPASMLHRSA